MRKLFTFTILTFLSISTQAQHLTAYIPSNAYAVATIKGKNLIDLLSVSEFNQSFAGKALLKKISEKSGKEFENATDLGILLEADAHYFYELNDSIGYHSVLIPLENASKFALLFDNKAEAIQKKNHYNILQDSIMTVLWDNQKALVTIGQARSIFFENDSIAARYNLTAEIDFYGYPREYIEEAQVSVDSTEVYEESEEIYEETEIYEEADTTYYESESLEENASEEPYTEYYGEDTSYIEDYYAEESYKPFDDNYFNKLSVKKQKLDSIARIWTGTKAETSFAFPVKTSILSNQDYLKSLDPKAEASFWIANPFFVYELDNALSSLFLKNSFFNSFGSISGHVYFEDDRFRVATNMKVEDEMAASFKNIYSRKINRKFLKYIDSNKALAYLGYGIDTEAYLEELPKLIENTYSPLMLGMGVDDGSISLGADLFSLLLDEKAVGKMIKGDALIVLNGISEKEVTYKDYEYDEDYNSTEVEKTKKESVPDFLFMASSDDTRLIVKLLDYAIAKELMSKEKGIYIFKDPIESFNFNLLLKDGILFLSTSFEDLYRIQMGTFKGYASKSHRKLIKKNNFLAYFSSKKMFDSVPVKDRDVLLSKAPFLYQMKDMGGLYMKSSGIKGNNVSGEFVIETSKDYKNALKYMFSLIESVAK